MFVVGGGVVTGQRGKRANDISPPPFLHPPPRKKAIVFEQLSKIVVERNELQLLTNIKSNKNIKVARNKKLN